MSTNIYDIAGAGMQAQSIRLNTIASNIANADTPAANRQSVYKPVKPVFATVYDQLANQKGVASVTVTEVVEANVTPVMRHEPGHPMANNQGYVHYPNVDVVAEMADMMSATRSFETNVEVLSSAKSMHQSLLRLGM